MEFFWGVFRRHSNEVVVHAMNRFHQIITIGFRRWKIGRVRKTWNTLLFILQCLCTTLWSNRRYSQDVYYNNIRETCLLCKCEPRFSYRKLRKKKKKTRKIREDVSLSSHEAFKFNNTREVCRAGTGPRNVFFFFFCSPLNPFTTKSLPRTTTLQLTLSTVCVEMMFIRDDADKTRRVARRCFLYLYAGNVQSKRARLFNNNILLHAIHSLTYFKFVLF